MSAESSLLLHCAREPERLAGLDLRGWDCLLRQARRRNLVARLADVAERLGLDERLPPPVRPHLLAARRLSRHQRDAVAWECRHLGSALGGLGVPVVLLKGAAYAMTDLEAARGRLFGDIDLLVASSVLPQVEAALMLAGWNTGTLDPYDERYYRQWSKELPPMAHVKRGTLVDVHHNILPPSDVDEPDASLLIGASRALPDSPFSVLSPEDLFIHSAVHLFHEGETVHALRDLLDLAALVREFDARDAGFLARVAERASMLRLAWPAALAARHLHRQRLAAVDADVRQAMEQATGWQKWRWRWLDALYDRAFGAAGDDADTGWAAAALYLRGHALRMPPGRLALHLGRKAAMRLVKHTSRST